MSPRKATTKSKTKRYIVTSKVCFGYADTAFDRGAVLTVNEEEKTFTDEMGRTFDDIRDITIARRNGIMVPYATKLAAELKATVDPAAPHPAPEKKQPPKMRVIKSDDDENRTIDIRWTKKQPEAEKQSGPMTVMRESHEENMRGMTVVRSGEESDGLGTPIGTAAVAPRGSATPKAGVKSSAGTPKNEVKTPTEGAMSAAEQRKAARLKSIEAGEGVLETA